MKSLPIKTVLQNFINHADSLEASKELNDEKYEQEFQVLKKLTEGLKNHPDYASIEGEKECNKRKNRYKDILPYDKTRVVLQPYPGVPGSDYVNANYIRGASGSRAYIASQGPLAHTVPDFWRMVVECDVQVIIMASNESEGGKHKCECYWVEQEGEEKQFGNVKVNYIKSRQVCPDFLVRTLKIEYPSEKTKAVEERTICQFHYMLWPDHGVPDSVRPLLDMVRLVRDCQASETLPVLIHCSAGCGRTGTICAIDYVWGLLRTGKLTQNFDLLGLVRQMRLQRVAMVQTKEQYMLLHKAVKELFRDRLSLIDSHPYENVSKDGNPLLIIERSKESDYEELFVSYSEKQDESSKTSTPSIDNNSLTRKLPEGDLQHLPAPVAKDNLRRSSSASSLDRQSRLSAYDSPLPNGSTEIKTIQSMVSLDSLNKRRKSHSKMEKEAENLAQKLEEDPPHPPVIPQEIPGLLSPPKPPPRSRTPSPIIDIRRWKNKPACFGAEVQLQRDGHRIINKLGIQKLRELFESSSTSVVAPPRTSKLSRSASSVTSRPNNLSLSTSDGTMSLKVRRKGSLDTENSSLRICPPPPPIKDDPDVGPSAIRFSPSVSRMKEENSALLSRLEDRPALPIKKSKSFRSTPPSQNDSRRSCEPPGSDSNRELYFSLDRTKGSVCSSEGSMKNVLVDKRIGLKMPSYQKRMKALTDNSHKGDPKPIIPPKKFIHDRYKNVGLSEDLSDTSALKLDSGHDLYDTLPSRPSPIRTFVKDISKPSSNTDNCHFSGDIEKHSRKADRVSDLENYIQISKDYVNARVLKNTSEDDGSPRYIYLPLPSKRATKDKKKSDYANCQSAGVDAVDSRSLKMSANKVITDYEPVDFAETLNKFDELVETVNYQLIGSSDTKKSKNSPRDYYLNRDLDSIAIQVYKDCQDYLLNAKTLSSIPSMMPGRLKEANDDKDLKTERAIEVQASKDEVTTLETVWNKVAVPPQGLKSRERRNSYRQAISPSTQPYNKLYERLNAQSSRKLIPRYEKIWFESNEAKSRPPWDGFNSDYSSNLDRHMNISGKDALFKDKLEELQRMVPKYDKMNLPNLCEESLSSKDSSSTSSLLSRSARSSKSSEKGEPLYVNIVTIHPSDSPVRRPSVEPSVFGNGQSNPMFAAASPYGTLATTSFPYKPKGNPSSIHESSGTSFSSFPLVHTSTLPARPAASHLPLSSIKISPPKEFRNSPPGGTSYRSQQQQQHSNEDSSSIYGYSEFGKRESQNRSNRISYSKLPPNAAIVKGQTTSDSISSCGVPLEQRDKSKLEPNPIPKVVKGMASFENVAEKVSSSSLNHTPYYLRPPPPKVVPTKTSVPKKSTYEPRNGMTKPYMPLYITPGNPNLKPLSSKRTSKDSTNRRSSDLSQYSRHIFQSTLPKSVDNCRKKRSYSQEEVNDPNCEKSKFYVENLPPTNGVMTTNDSIGKTSNLLEMRGDSSTEDDEGIFQKISASNLLRKLKTPARVHDFCKRPSSPGGSTFYTPREDASQTSEGQDDSSSRSFSKAFGKLKSAAANFKVYLNTKGDADDSSGVSAHQGFIPLQKSASATASFFTAVSHPHRKTNSKPSDSKVQLNTFKSYVGDKSSSSVVVNRSRQHYL